MARYPFAEACYDVSVRSTATSVDMDMKDADMEIVRKETVDTGQDQDERNGLEMFNALSFQEFADGMPGPGK